MSLLSSAPGFSVERVRELLRAHYGLEGELHALPSERDQNFRVDAGPSGRYVLKIANSREDRAFLEAQNAMLLHLGGKIAVCPRLVPAAGDEPMPHVDGAEGRSHLVRLVTYLEGKPLADVTEHPPELLSDLGGCLGRMDRELATFDHAALHRSFHWDLARGTEMVARYGSLIDDATVRRGVDRLVESFERHAAPRLSRLRRSVIHNDANDHNVIVRDDGPKPRIAGLVDFGDALHGYTVGDLAIAIAYAVLDKREPLDVAAAMTRGYHEQYPLTSDEIAALYGLVCLRLCSSVCLAVHQTRQRPDDAYLSVSQEPIRRTLPRLLARPFELAETVLREACDLTATPLGPYRTDARSDAEALAQRRARLGANLSLGYRVPVRLNRGWMQYLYGTDGSCYLDAYNNVPHVGHCHPRVVSAAARQMRRLNTNTRYLCDALGEYAERLARTFPDPLEVCYFVNSASEANELALRLARSHTGGRDTIVLGGAYHGHTTTLIDISPYKHAGPGGEGAPEWVHVVPLPDLYRGPYREADAVAKYVGHVADHLSALQARGVGLACFIAETCPSVGGQLFLPASYLEQVYERVRAAGGLCIADEVQTGYGRIGTHFYAFEEHGVVPDIVVLGKPIGNGHPVAAVITSRTVADAFDNGMEFFSTFGGNTVACEVGLAVLDVVREEGLQSHARRVGRTLIEGLRGLQEVHESIGQVRGSGLFLGVELVGDRARRDPAASQAAAVVNFMRDEGVLIGTDGPDRNVLKIRPPMPFDETDAERVLETLDRSLRRAPFRPTGPGS